MKVVLNRIRSIDYLSAIFIAVAVTTAFSILGKNFSYRSLDFFAVKSTHIPHYLVLVVSVYMFYLAVNIKRRKISSFYVALSTLSVLLLNEIVLYRDPLKIALYVAVLLLVYLKQSEFVVKSNAISWRKTSGLLIAQFIFIIGFSVVIFVILDQLQFGRNTSTRESFNITVNAVFEGSEPSKIMLSRQDKFMISILRFSIVLSFFSITSGIYRPIKFKRKLSPADALKARRLLEKYGGGPDDFFQLWPTNKHYYFYKNSFVSYTVSTGVAIVLFGGKGNVSDLKLLRRSFVRECHSNGWLVAVLNVDEAESKEWENEGLSTSYIGSEAIVDVNEFVSRTSRSKHFRYVSNKAIKDELDVCFWVGPHSDEKFVALRNVSDQWLANGHREYRYIMGTFEPDYLNHCSVAVLTEKNKIVAYANIIPSFNDTFISIDHMRYVPGTSNIGMHFLLMSLLNHASILGKTSFNLGLSPLSKLNSQPDSAATSILKIVRILGDRYYSFAGLEQFKGKFSPSWQPRKIVHDKSEIGLVKIFYALHTLTKFKTQLNMRKIIGGLAVLSIVFYSIFPLGYILNPGSINHELVSYLGQPNQPYSWLFNISDIASGSIMILVCYWLVTRQKKLPSALTNAVYLLALSSVATILAAVTPLPADVTVNNGLVSLISNPVVVFHGLASTINTSSMAGSLLCWGYYYFSTYNSKRRLLAVMSVCTFGFTGLFIGYSNSLLVAYWQRTFIVMSAVILSISVLELIGYDSNK